MTHNRKAEHGETSQRYASNIILIQVTCQTQKGHSSPNAVSLEIGIPKLHARTSEYLPVETCIPCRRLPVSAFVDPCQHLLAKSAILKWRAPQPFCGPHGSHYLGYVVI